MISISPFEVVHSPCLRAALARLLGECKCAEALRRPVWDFAVGIGQLRETGISGKVLRLLIDDGYVEHRVETTPRAGGARRFRLPVRPAWNWRSNFVLTARGEELALEILGDSDHSWANNRDAASEGRAPGNREKPCWDAGVRELRYRCQVIKRFRRAAPNQEYLLQALQELDWPLRIDDPLPKDREVDSSERLRETAKSLNRGQSPHLIRFRVEATGQGIRWEAD
jgi:hypothetical protein